MKNPWTKLSHSYVYEHYPFMKVRKDQVIAPNDEKSSYSVVERPNVVTIIARDENKNIAFTKQWRYPIGRQLKELPMGIIDMGEKPEEAAKRELEEETGWIGNEFRFLAKLYSSPGIMNNVNFIYFTEVLEKKSQTLDKYEKINITEINDKEIENILKEHEIIDNTSISALFYYKLFCK